MPPYFRIGFHVRGNAGFDGRRLHLRIVVRRGLLATFGLGDLVDTTSDHFVHRPLAAVLWSELPGQERSFDEEAVALFVRRGDVGSSPENTRLCQLVCSCF